MKNPTKWFLVLCAGMLVSLGAIQVIVSGDAGDASISPPVGPEKTSGNKGINTGKKPLPLVRVETVGTATLTKTAELTGSVVPTRTARLASPKEGPVASCAQSCWVREGDRVVKGQILLQISRKKAAEAQLLAARQSLKEQKAELKRVEQLVQAGAIPGAQLDTARSKYENARAQLAQAKESNEDYFVSAPWDGIVSKVHVIEGDYVAPRTLLIEIFDPASLVVQFAVPETRAVEIQNGMPVQVRLDAYPGKTFQGRISRVYPELDERMRTRTVEAEVSGPVKLLPGMFARVQVVLARYADAVAVPAAAVLGTGGEERSLFVFQNGTARRRLVQTGIEESGRVQILSGVHPGEKVIVAGHESLADGASVRTPKEEKP